jgi:hypothetical protein
MPQEAIIFSSHFGTGNVCVSRNQSYTQLLAHLFVVIVGEIFIFPSVPLLEGDIPLSQQVLVSPSPP